MALNDRQLNRSLIITLALVALIAVGPPNRAADQPPGGAPQESLNRFRLLSPEERLQQAEKVTGGTPVFVPVMRGDLDVTIIERGTLDPAQASDIVCRVKNSGTDKPAATIRWVIDDGTLVKKGDRLIELDDSGLREQLDLQKVVLAQAMAAKIAADADRKIVGKQNQLDILTAEINLKRAKLALKRYTDNDADEKEILELSVKEAQLQLDMHKLRHQAREVQAEADVKAKTVIEEQERKRTEALQEQLSECVLKAPQDGLAVYYVPEGSRFGGSTLAVGEPVREGQKLLRVCGLERMALTTRIHEAQIAGVRIGQKATVRVDAFPQKTLRAQVKEVARVASQQDWLSADVKVYPVRLELTDQLKGLKPGMTAEVRIEVDRRPKVLQVPVLSILRRGGQTFCYVKVGKGLQERKVTTGARNNLYVEIKDGLKESEQVLHDPGAVVAPRTRPKAKGGKGPRAQAPGLRPAQVLVRSVRPASGFDGRRSRVQSYGLTYKDLEQIRAVPNVTQVVPVRSFPIEARRLQRQASVKVVGTVAGYRELGDLKLAGGRFLDDEDDAQIKNVAVLGADIADRLFDESEPVGKVVRLGNSSFVVVGILQEQDHPVADQTAEEVNHGVYIPLRTCNARFGETLVIRRAGSFTREAVPLTEVLVSVQSPRQVGLVVKSITAFLEKTHLRTDWDIQAAPVVQEK